MAAAQAGPHLRQFDRRTIRFHSKEWDLATHDGAAIHNQGSIRRPDRIDHLTGDEANRRAAIHRDLEQPRTLHVSAGCHDPRAVRRPVGAALASRTLYGDGRGQRSCIRAVRRHDRQPQFPLLSGDDGHAECRRVTRLAAPSTNRWRPSRLRTDCRPGTARGRRPHPDRTSKTATSRRSAVRVPVRSAAHTVERRDPRLVDQAVAHATGWPWSSSRWPPRAGHRDSLTPTSSARGRRSPVASLSSRRQATTATVLIGPPRARHRGACAGRWARGDSPLPATRSVAPACRQRVERATRSSLRSVPGRVRSRSTGHPVTRPDCGCACCPRKSLHRRQRSVARLRSCGPRARRDRRRRS